MLYNEVMDNNKKLFETIKKEVVSIKEFQYIANHDFVSAVTYTANDGLHENCARYIVRYINADSDVIYVKR